VIHVVSKGERKAVHVMSRGTIDMQRRAAMHVNEQMRGNSACGGAVRTYDEQRGNRCAEGSSCA
jgi:hypothetical protein